MQTPNLLIAPQRESRAIFNKNFGQRFIVTVDTEEEFDWNAPLDREKHSTTTIPALQHFQRFCENFDVVPTYLIDWPVANNPNITEAIGCAVSQGKAEVGIQLHPWVSPPFTEDVNQYNSYAGNLPFELERAKIHSLRDKIEETFGVSPQIYRAGRYGLGSRTAEILMECGVSIDTSVRSRFNYSGTYGPNYRSHPVHPYWADPARKLLELPLTTVYWGPLRQLGNIIYPYLWRAPQIRGVLARTQLLQRISLTPEGITSEEALRAVDVALTESLPILVFSFHSPSLAIGHTPYVRNQVDLELFYNWWQTLFLYLDERGVKPTSVKEICSSVDNFNKMVAQPINPG